MDDAQDIQSIPPEDEGHDLTDELPDYSLLHILTSQGHHTIPRRGEKDFEPHGTVTQRRLLDTSLDAMVNALSGLRTHAPKTHVPVKYDGTSGRAVVEKPKGQLFNTFGKGKADGQIDLSQEDLLYLLERGSLDGRASDPRMSPLPSSLQQTYSILTQLHLEAYTVFAGLRRNGYIVSRASDDRSTASKSSSYGSPSEANRAGIALGSGCKWWSSGSESSMTLLKPGLYRCLEAVQRALSIVPFYDARQTPSGTSFRLREARDSTSGADEHQFFAKSPLLRTLFYVWKPRPGFKKSAPGRPDFQIAVLGTNESLFPKLWELDELLTETVPATLEADRNNGKTVYARLRDRKRNAFLAVVDQGIVSYVKVTDAQFGRERLQLNAGRNVSKGASKGVKSGSKTARRL